MYARFQELMTEKYALSNKLHFGEWSQHQYEEWIRQCRSLLSLCQPEPYFPWNPDPHHIEELVMLLSATDSRISRGKIEYMGISSRSMQGSVAVFVLDFNI